MKLSVDGMHIRRIARTLGVNHQSVANWVKAQVWRDAWDLLLTDTMTLDQICAALAVRGHRFRSGKPFTR